jgi:hypothetical protein
MEGLGKDGDKAMRGRTKKPACHIGGSPFQRKPIPRHAARTAREMTEIDVNVAPSSRLTRYVVELDVLRR